MNKAQKFGISVSILVLILAMWIAFPLDKKLTLGLDLKGGLDLVLAVDTEKLRESTLNKLKIKLKSEFVTKTLPGVVIKTNKAKDPNSLFLDISKLEQKHRVQLETILDKVEKITVKGSCNTDNNIIVTLSLKNSESQALDKALLIIRNRINQFGVAEPLIKKVEGRNRIQIQLPGIKNASKAVDLIRKTGFLQFNLVKRIVSSPIQAQATMDEETEILLKEERVTRRDGKKTVEKIWYILEKDPAMTGDKLSDARQGFGGMTGSEALVYLTFSGEGAVEFANVTSKNVKKQLAIILDGKIKSAPSIKQPIMDGSAVIEGRFSLEEAKTLAMVLKCGSLPAPVKILETRIVGPTLGAESIKRGVMAILFGFLAVMIYMIVYYKFLGILSVFALFFNLTLLAAGLAIFEATLTLPGIAGIILTIGMAVDANVIIFERIKEELRAGKTLRASIEAGFRKAFITIFDANITTLLTAFVLFQVGSGPVKGFAVTLALGILASMFTALYVVKFFILGIVNIRKLKSLNI
ncbi:protein translocase subunit SecD [bacterium]|nr:protein translocase subunit SecD [bacterium]